MIDNPAYEKALDKIRDVFVSPCDNEHTIERTEEKVTIMYSIYCRGEQDSVLLGKQIYPSNSSVNSEYIIQLFMKETIAKHRDALLPEAILEAVWPIIYSAALTHVTENYDFSAKDEKDVR